EAIYREYGQLYPAFEDIVTTGGEAADRLKLADPVMKALVTVANENVKVSKVTITGHLVLTSTRPDGVNVIRRALRSAQPKVEDVEIDLIYVGAPKYRIKVTAPDYKEAEKAIEKAANAAVGVVERAGGSGKFIRKQKAG
ncbi:MAG: translation initiation factor IF-2 subunit alpha, partial [Methanoculleus sp.]|nr:translation initiation factor IF-2 subunit alpha [Methanoculleus sp.]